MTINQILSEMEKKLEEYTVSKEAYKLNDTGADYVFIYDLKNFVMKDFTRKLIESVAEEMKYIVALHRLSAWSPQDKDLELISKGSKTTADAITDDIDLKVKEIINQISK